MSQRSEMMTAMRRFFQKGAGWIIVWPALILMASSVSALDLPGFKSLKLPSFRYGKIKRDRDVNQIFQTYKILPDHTYYTAGQGNNSQISPPDSGRQSSKKTVIQAGYPSNQGKRRDSSNQKRWCFPGN